MLGNDDIGGVDIGAAEAELEGLQYLATPLGARIAATYKQAWGCMFSWFGADIVFRREREDDVSLRVNTKAFFRNLMEREIVAPIMASDMSVLIDPAPLLAAGVEWPARVGDKIVRAPGAPAESLYTVQAPPADLDVAGQLIVTRLVVRGG